MTAYARPVAITVSTNFSDVLPHVLAHNQGYFDHWYIVTAPGDSATKSLCENYEGVTVLDYEFTYDYPDHRGRPQKRYFDKGGAIALAQQRAYEEYPDHWYLVMDTDIVIRSARDLTTEQLCPTYIYGVQQRMDYRSYRDYLEHRIYREYFPQVPVQVMGFFQLYKQQCYYSPSIDTNWCDIAFTNRWRPDERKILPITVDHLGYWPPGSANTHRGRTLGEGWLE